jgi:hypothetical protein
MTNLHFNARKQRGAPIANCAVRLREVTRGHHLEEEGGVWRECKSPRIARPIDVALYMDVKNCTTMIHIVKCLSQTFLRP